MSKRFYCIWDDSTTKLCVKHLIFCKFVRQQCRLGNRERWGASHAFFMKKEDEEEARKHINNLKKFEKLIFFNFWPLTASYPYHLFVLVNFVSPYCLCQYISTFFSTFYFVCLSHLLSLSFLFCHLFAFVKFVWTYFCQLFFFCH